MHRTLLVIAVSAILLSAPPGASVADADPIRDQSYTPPPLLSFGFGSDVQLSQTLRVGITGVLTSVELPLGLSHTASTFADLLLDLRPVVGGVPVNDDAAALVIAPLSQTSIPDQTAFLPIDLAARHLTVTAGEELAIVLRAPGTTNLAYAWRGSAINQYDGGAAFFRRQGFPTWTPLFGDLGFQTFVAPEAVPEPATLVFFVSGVLGTAVRSRLNRRIQHRMT
jgi:hypothetical protein